MADVYVLASPAPTLYVYPSALHPEPPPPPPDEDTTNDLYGYAYPYNVINGTPRRRQEEALLLALQLI